VGAATTFSPAKLFPHKLETFMASLSPRQAQEIRASTDSVFWDDVPLPTIALPTFEQAFQNAGPEQYRIAFEHDLQQLEKYKLTWGNGFIHCNKLLKTSVFLTCKGINSLRDRFPKYKNRWDFFHKIYYINSLHQPPLVPF